jgi:hypothetical protein
LKKAETFSPKVLQLCGRLKHSRSAFCKPEKGRNSFVRHLASFAERLFTQTVLDAYCGGNIEPTFASNLLNVKVNNFPKLESQMYRWM